MEEVQRSSRWKTCSKIYKTIEQIREIDMPQIDSIQHIQYIQREYAIYAIYIYIYTAIDFDRFLNVFNYGCFTDFHLVFFFFKL